MPPRSQQCQPLAEHVPKSTLGDAQAIFDPALIDPLVAERAQRLSDAPTGLGARKSPWSSATVMTTQPAQGQKTSIDAATPPRLPSTGTTRR